MSKLYKIRRTTDGLYVSGSKRLVFDDEGRLFKSHKQMTGILRKLSADIDSFAVVEFKLDEVGSVSARDQLGMSNKNVG